jgi:polar amino acid transport system substrate-binding protein
MIWFRIFLTLFLLVGPVGSTSSAETWRITSLEWPPYSGSNLKGGGKAIAALRAVLKEAEIDLEVDFMPWTRAQSVATAPEYVGYFPAWPEEVREGFTASDTVDLSLVGVLQRKGSNANWATIEELFKNYRVGFVKSYVYPAELQRQIYQNYDPEDGAEDEHDLARVLDAGRVDVALTDPKVMMHVAKELSLTGIDANAKILQQHPLVLALSMKEGFEEKRLLLNSLLSQFSDLQPACCLKSEQTLPAGSLSKPTWNRQSHSVD